MKSCKDITYLIEKSKEVKLSYKERLQIKMHINMCKFCRTYKIDSKFLDKVLGSFKSKKMILDAKEKGEMLNEIKSKLDK
jgi:ADP-dependent phosphofructokinase/glucokinase